MTAYINKIKSKAGDQQLPVTHERAVRDDNGTTLESKMQNLEGAMDKAYVASSDNGMGRITLKKNMVSGVNTLTQSMMQATNTIYVIQYDFTLASDVTIPANCVLEFEGGKILPNSHSITGNLLNKELNVKNFMSGSDITKALQTCLNICNKVFIPSGNYTISNPGVTVGANKTICGESQFTTVISKNSVYSISINGNNVNISGLHIVGINDVDTQNAADNIAIEQGAENIHIFECIFEKDWACVYCNGQHKNIVVNDCIFKSAYYSSSSSTGGYGIAIGSSNVIANTYGAVHTEIYNCIFEDDVYRHCLYLKKCEDVKVHHNTFKGKKTGFEYVTRYENRLQIDSGNDIEIQNNYAEGGVSFVGFNEVNSVYPKNVSISGNIIKDQCYTSNDNGAINIKGENIIIANNVFENVFEAMYASAFTKCLKITNNECHTKDVLKYSLFLLFTGGNTHEDVFVEGNTFVSGQCTNKTLACRIFNTTVKNVIIRNNYIYGHHSYSYSIDNSSITTVSGKLIFSGNYGNNGVLMNGNIPEVIMYTENIASEHPSITTSLKRIVDNNLTITDEVTP